MNKKSNAPGTLKELLKKAGPPLWRGKAYQLTAYANAEQFIKIVGNLPLSEIDLTTIDDYVEELAGTVSNATINRKLTNAHSLLQYGAERGWLTMPSFKKKWLEESKGRVRWITPEEETKMLAFLESEPEVRRFVIILMETGLRRGELLNLKPADVDGPWIRLWVTKTKEPRSVPVSERAQSELSKGLPFQLEVPKLRCVWDRLRKHMGLEDDPNFVLHCLRHTAATRMLARTGNLAVVQKFLGHSDIETTLRYAHISDHDLLSAVR